MSTTAYSYMRFSTAIQLKGDSTRRQLNLATTYIKNNPDLNLKLDDTLNLDDRGISAFRGKNIKEGGLGHFIKAVEEGRVKSGSYLLVENLDRLSRQNVETAYTQLSSLLSLGIVVVTLMDNKIYQQGKLSMLDMITSLLIMERAHEESKTKSLRVQQAWDAKKDVIHEKKLTKWCPSWLNLSDDRKNFELIPERVDLVKQIFQWTIDGLGTSLIIKKIEQSEIAPWDDERIELTTRRAKNWHGSKIQRIISDRTVLGEFTLHKGSETSTIENYFPQIIDIDTYHRAIKSRQNRNQNGGGRKGNELTNLFSKLAKCGYSLDNNYGGYRCSGDSHSVVLANKGAGTQNKYLQCARLKNGNTGCRDCRKMWRYDNFELSFFTFITDIDISVLLGDDNTKNSELAELRQQIEKKHGELIHNKRQQEGFTESLATLVKVPNAMLNKMIELEQSETNLNNDILVLESTLKDKDYIFNNSNNVKNELSGVIEKLANIDDSKELFNFRFKISNLLKDFIESIEIYTQGKIISEDYFLKVEDKLGLEAANVMRENEKQTAKKQFPFYVVNFKSGEKRFVAVNPKNALELRLSVKFSEDGELLESVKNL